jgi:hypothetical protein
MNGASVEDADRLRVGGWVLQKDALSAGDADDVGDVGDASDADDVGDVGDPEQEPPEPAAGDPEPESRAADPNPGPVPPGRSNRSRGRIELPGSGGRIGLPAKALAGAAAVVVLLTVLAVAAYQSMTRAPAAGPAGYGAEPGASRAAGALPSTDPSGVPAPSASRSGRPVATPLHSAPASAPAPSPAGPPAVPGEAVSNGGFESGTLAGWSCAGNLGRVVTSPVHSGRYALAADAGLGRTAQCSQEVPVQPGKRYTLSAWVSGERVYLGVSGADLADPETSTGSAAYTQLRLTFVAPAGTSSVTVWVHGWYAPGTYYADDISLN